MCILALLCTWAMIFSTVERMVFRAWRWYCWRKKSCTNWYGKYPIIYRVSYMSGGAGFCASTVSMISSIWTWKNSLVFALAKQLLWKGLMWFSIEKLSELHVLLVGSMANLKEEWSLRWLSLKRLSYMDIYIWFKLKRLNSPTHPNFNLSLSSDYRRLSPGCMFRDACGHRALQQTRVECVRTSRWCQTCPLQKWHAKRQPRLSLAWKKKLKMNMKMTSPRTRLIIHKYNYHQNNHSQSYSHPAHDYWYTPQKLTAGTWKHPQLKRRNINLNHQFWGFKILVFGGCKEEWATSLMPPFTSTSDIGWICRNSGWGIRSKSSMRINSVMRFHKIS